jgi:hypothetical protein
VYIVALSLTCATHGLRFLVAVTVPVIHCDSSRVTTLEQSPRPPRCVSTGPVFVMAIQRERERELPLDYRHPNMEGLKPKLPLLSTLKWVQY